MINSAVLVNDISFVTHRKSDNERAYLAENNHTKVLSWHALNGISTLSHDKESV